MPNSGQSPPLWAQRLLKWFCHPDLHEQIEGDLNELYEAWHQDPNCTHPNWAYTREVLGLFRPRLLRPFPSISFQTYPRGMYKNYLKLAFRNIWRNKAFSAINLFGLAISMAVCLLLILMINDQYGYDTDFEHKDRICRVVSERTQKQTGSKSQLATAPMPMAQALQEQCPFVEEVVRIKGRFGGEAVFEGKTIPLGGIYADQSFLEVFEVGWVRGDPTQALLTPNSLVLTETGAQKLLGDMTAVGQLVEVPGTGTFLVSGIIQDPPPKSHIQYEALASISTLVQLEKEERIYACLDNWINLNDNYVYLLLEPGKSPEDLTPFLAEIVAQQYDEGEKATYSYQGQALLDITPGPSYSNELGPVMPEIMLFFLILLGFIVILSAGFNYANLSIARSLDRAKEVGIRKVSGAFRAQLMWQFLIESTVFAVIALGIACLLLELLIPAFFQLDPNIQEIFELTRTPVIYLTFLGFSLLVGGISGLLPALHLASFNPVKVLKGSNNIRVFSRLTARKVLIVTQFVFSMVFVISVFLAQQQLTLSLNADMGFTTEGIVNIDLQGNDYKVVSQVLTEHTGIVSISGSSNLPANGSQSSNPFKHIETGESVSLTNLAVDQAFIPNLEIELIAGENFPAEASRTHEQYIILNQPALAAFKFESPEAAIGELLEFNSETTVKVIGVLGDFRYRKASKALGPFALRYLPETFRYANVKLSSQNVHRTLVGLESSWKQVDPTHDLSYRFFDDEIKEQFTGLMITLRIIGFLSFLVCSIACLGLLGMAIYHTKTKEKEVGIRKVIGASNLQLVVLLSKGFVSLILIAALIALPIAFFVNQLWLENFALKISLFSGLVSGFGVMLLLGLLTIVSQTFKAARANPIDALKDE